MKMLIAMMLVAVSASANIVDSTYTVVPPVTGSQCPAIQPDLPPGYNCYYVALGGFTDTYQFNVPIDAFYSFAVNGNHWRRYVSSGRAHVTYAEDMTITNAVVVDAAGNMVLQLEFTGYVVVGSSTQDDWAGLVQLPPGDYSFLITGFVTGNRPGVYGYDIHDPTPIIVD